MRGLCGFIVCIVLCVAGADELHKASVDAASCHDDAWGAGGQHCCQSLAVQHLKRFEWPP